MVEELVWWKSTFLESTKAMGFISSTTKIKIKYIMFMHKNGINEGCRLPEMGLPIPLDPDIVSFSIDVIIHHGQKQLDEERIHFIL